MTWTPIRLQFPLVGVLAVDPQDSGTVYAVSAAAIDRTVDGGETWRFAGLVPGVTTLYAATGFGGYELACAPPGCG